VDIPETHYAKSGDVSIAYQVLGEGPFDLIWVQGLVSNGDAVMDAVESPRAALLGSSDGAALSVLFAATYPERTTALILWSGFPRYTWAPDYPWGMSEQEAEEENEATIRSWNDLEAMAKMVEDLAPDTDEAAKRALASSWRQSAIAVHTDARVAASARPGEVLVSSMVKDLVAGSGLAFEDRGRYELKGIPGDWRLFAVSAGESVPA
jgi:pimeloyl-ACP methyl ester carboxylesterase